MEPEPQLTGWLGYVREDSILHEQLAWIVTAFDWVTATIDLLGCVLLLIGAARFVAGVVGAELSRDTQRRVRGMNAERVELGRYILGGLELLIVSDIVHTALSLAMIDLIFLGFLVIIRSLISFFLDRELEQLKKDLTD